MNCRKKKKYSRFSVYLLVLCGSMMQIRFRVFILFCFVFLSFVRFFLSIFLKLNFPKSRFLIKTNYKFKKKSINSIVFSEFFVMFLFCFVSLWNKSLVYHNCLVSFVTVNTHRNMISFIYLFILFFQINFFFFFLCR